MKLIQCLQAFIGTGGACLAFILGTAWAGTTEVLGVLLPPEKIVAGKKLTLNGTAYKKVLWVEVCAGGLYLEHPTQNRREIVESEQVKCVYVQYLTELATAQRIQEALIKEFATYNSPELIADYAAEINTFVSWFDRDCNRGGTSITTYIPGQGLTLEYMGEIKGTIRNSEFARMYFRNAVRDKADKPSSRQYVLHTDEH